MGRGVWCEGSSLSYSLFRARTRPTKGRFPGSAWRSIGSELYSAGERCRLTDEFRDWWDTLSETQQGDIAHGLDLLQAKGHGLGFPWTSAIKGADFALRELRVQSKGRPIRVLYAFDPARSAVLLIGGEKKGQPRFYERMIRISERLWNEYLASYSN